MDRFEINSAPNVRILENSKLLSEKRPFNAVSETDRVARINSITGCTLLTVFMGLIIFGTVDMDAESRVSHIRDCYESRSHMLL